ncbi:hypothetical protein WJX82_006264 [Trebouxia sp. C0006]
MPFNQAQLIEETLVQPRGVTHQAEAIKLCILDIRRPTLTERIPFYEAVQANAINAHEVALPTTATAFTQVVDAERMLTGQQALLKVQVTHCGDDQTMLGITIAQVLSVKPMETLTSQGAQEHQQGATARLPVTTGGDQELQQ